MPPRRRSRQAALLACRGRACAHCSVWPVLGLPCGVLVLLAAGVRDAGVSLVCRALNSDHRAAPFSPQPPAQHQH